MPERLYISEQEQNELFKMRGDREPLSLCFGGGRVWLDEPYEDRDLDKLGELRGITRKEATDA